MSNYDTDAFDLVLLGTLDPADLYEQCKETGPNKLAEKYIAKDGFFSYMYACKILKGRFEAGEAAIYNGLWKELYENFLKNGSIHTGFSQIF